MFRNNYPSLTPGQRDKITAATLTSSILGFALLCGAAKYAGSRVEAQNERRFEKESAEVVEALHDDGLDGTVEWVTQYPQSYTQVSLKLGNCSLDGVVAQVKRMGARITDVSNYEFDVPESNTSYYFENSADIANGIEQSVC